ncbi:MAG: hypothetical protein PVH63_13275 [Balneolaceae bacterium]|jgi:type I restriction enzyme R subunit
MMAVGLPPPLCRIEMGLEKLKQEKLVMDWTKQQQRIADVKVTIKQELDQILPKQYDRQLFAQTCNEVFDHVWQSY